MKYFLLALALLVLPGCFGSAQKMAKSYDELITQLPDYEFSKFEYHRGGMYSSAHITATDAIKEDDLMMIESINIVLNYGPESLTISVEDYQREFNTSN